MVMVDDAKIRNNRAALLQQLGLFMNQVADISKLAVEK
jgi:glycyl-tRNA synthetase beta subunit